MLISSDSVSFGARRVLNQHMAKVARDYELSYPENGEAIGIGPIKGEVISVYELDSDHAITIISPDGRIDLHCESDGIEIATKEP